MNILVTGGAGYVGSHTVKHLLESGHEAWVYDNLSTGHAASVPEGRLIVGELNDAELLRYVLRGRGIDGVMHFAASALVGESVEHPAKYYQNNLVATLSLMEAMRDCGVSRFVLSSTAATYGAPDAVPIRESAPQQPCNPYGFTKLALERALSDYAAAYGWGVAALRYFNAAGAAADGSLGEDHSPESHLIPIILQVALGQRDGVTIFGDDYPTPDGTCIRDYVHVEDLASAHLAAMAKLDPGIVLKMNLGTGKGYSVREVIDACRSVTGLDICQTIGKRRPGDPPELVADASLAMKTLSWQPKFTTIESIVESAWAWHQAHPRGYAPNTTPSPTSA